MFPKSHMLKIISLSFHTQALVCWSFFFSFPFSFFQLHSINLAPDGNIPLHFLPLSKYFKLLSYCSSAYENLVSRPQLQPDQGTHSERSPLGCHLCPISMCLFSSLLWQYFPHYITKSSWNLMFSSSPVVKPNQSARTLPALQTQALSNCPLRQTTPKRHTQAFSLQKLHFSWLFSKP